MKNFDHLGFSYVRLFSEIFRISEEESDRMDQDVVNCLEDFLMGSIIRVKWFHSYSA